jgi:hypothetical protein
LAVSKAEAADSIQETLRSLKTLLREGSSASPSEADTRVHFIDPILRALGWTALGEIQREVYVRDTKEFIDYTLSVNGQPRIAVEAKRLSFKLNEAAAGQLIQYCAILGIEWAVLTNGAEWRVYHQFAQVPLAEKLLFRLDLAGWQSEPQYIAIFEQLWLLSKEAFLVSDGPGAWMRAQKLDAALRDGLTNPASPEVRYLTKQLASHGLTLTTEDVSTWFKSRLLEPAPLPAPPVTSTSPVSQPGHGPTSTPGVSPRSDASTPGSYWLVPAAPQKGLSAMECLREWLGHGMWGFGESTPSRKALQAGDCMCFYAVGTGVVATAEIAGAADTLVEPREWPQSTPQEGPTYKIPLQDVRWLETPVKVDASLRSTLETFAGRDANGPWSWLVQTTRRLSPADFRRLTGQGPETR